MGGARCARALCSSVMGLHEIYLVWLLVGVPVLVAGWILLRRVRRPFARHASRAVFGALVGGIGVVGGHGAIPVPAVLLLFDSQAFTTGLLYLAIWSAMYFGVSKAIEGSRIALGLVMAPVVLVGGLIVYDHAEQRARQAAGDARFAAEVRAARAERLARAQSFEWVVDGAGGLTLVVSPGPVPLTSLQAPPAPAAGRAHIRGLPGAAAPASSQVLAMTATALATGAIRNDLSYDIELVVEAGQRIELVHHELQQGQIQLAPQAARADGDR